MIYYHEPSDCLMHSDYVMYLCVSSIGLSPANERNTYLCIFSDLPAESYFTKYMNDADWDGFVRLSGGEDV